MGQSNAHAVVTAPRTPGMHARAHARTSYLSPLCLVSHGRLPRSPPAPPPSPSPLLPHVAAVSSSAAWTGTFGTRSIFVTQQYTCDVLLLFIWTTRYLRCRQRLRRVCSGEDRADAHDVGNGFGCACRLVACWIRAPSSLGCSAFLWGHAARRHDRCRVGAGCRPACRRLWLAVMRGLRHGGGSAGW